MGSVSRVVIKVAAAFARLLAANQFGESRRGKQRAIAIEHHHQSRLGGKGRAAGQQRMAGALLFGLLDKTNAGGRQERPNLIGLMPHHHSSVAGRRDGAGRMDHMFDQGKPAGAMQHFGALGFHPGAKAGGQDHHIGLGCH